MGRLIIIFSYIFFFFKVNPVFCQISVYNNISGNIVWEKEKGPFIIEEKIIFSAGSTLSIKQGAQVLFKDNSGLIFLSGSELKVLGAVNDSVFFKPFDTAVNYFDGILLRTGMKSSIFKYNLNELIPTYDSGSIINYASFSGRNKNIIYASNSTGQIDTVMYYPNFKTRGTLITNHRSFKSKDSLAKFYGINSGSFGIVQIDSVYQLEKTNQIDLNSFMHGGFLKIDNEVGLLLMNSSFNNNTSLYGAAISMYPGPRFFYKCSFSQNESAIYGGALTLGEQNINEWKNGYLIFNSCNISNNKSLRYGGIALGANGTQVNFNNNIGIRMLNNTINNNYGGALFLNPLGCSNAIFEGNIFEYNTVDFKFQLLKSISGESGRFSYTNDLTYNNQEDRILKLGVDGTLEVYSSCLKLWIQFNSKVLFSQNKVSHNKGNNSIAFTSGFKRMNTTLINNYFSENISSRSYLNGFYPNNNETRFFSVPKIAFWDSDLTDTRVAPLNNFITGNEFIRNENPVLTIPGYGNLTNNQFYNNYTTLPADSLIFGSLLYGIIRGDNNIFSGNNSYVASYINMGRYVTNPTQTVNINSSFWNTILKTRIANKILDIGDDPLLNSPQFLTDSLIPRTISPTLEENVNDLLNFNLKERKNINETPILYGNLDSSVVIKISGTNLNSSKSGIIPFRIYDSLNRIVHLGNLLETQKNSGIFTTLIVPTEKNSIFENINDDFFIAKNNSFYRIEIGEKTLFLFIGQATKSLTYIEVDKKSCDSSFLKLKANLVNADSTQIVWLRNDTIINKGALFINADRIGIYKLHLKDNTTGKTIDSSFININSLIKLSIYGKSNLCFQNNENNQVTPVKIYINQGFQNVIWSNLFTKDTLNVSSAGLYKVQASNQYGCKYSDSININAPFQVYNNFSICNLSFDTTNSRFVINFNKTNFGRNIKFINVYRSLSSGFQLIGKITPSENYFVDSLNSSISFQRSYRVSIIDSCDNESKFSNEHKPFFLQVNKGTYDTIANLTWSKYLGLSYDKVYIYKGSSKNSLRLIDSVPSTISNYTDFNLNNLERTYALAMNLNNNCSSTEGIQIIEKKIFSELSSVPNIVTSINSFSIGESIKIFPNPTYNDIVVDYKLNGLDKRINLSIFNLAGLKIYENEINTTNFKLNLDKFHRGVYIVKIYSKSRNIQYVSKLIKL